MIFKKVHLVRRLILSFNMFCSKKISVFKSETTKRPFEIRLLDSFKKDIARVSLPVRRGFLHILLICVHISLMSLTSFHSWRVKDDWGDIKKPCKEREHAEMCLKRNDIAFPLKHHVKLFLMHSWICSSFLYSYWHKPLSSWLFWYIHWYSHCYGVIFHSFSRW